MPEQPNEGIPPGPETKESREAKRQAYCYVDVDRLLELALAGDVDAQHLLACRDPDRYSDFLRVAKEEARRFVPPGSLSTVTLSWRGSYRLRVGVSDSLFTAPDATETGLYLWTTATPSGQLIQYVGETGAGFATRHRTHLKALRSGQDTIDRATSFAAGRRDPVYRGYLWSETQRMVQDPIFRAGQAEFLAELDRLLDVVQIFIAPLHAEKRILWRIETAIVRRIRAAGTTRWRFSNRTYALWIAGRREAALRVVSRSEHVLRGLPSQFEA